MSTEMEPADAAELRQRREAVRNGLARASAAAFGAVLVVILLALVAIVVAFRVEERAIEAQQVTENFWQDSTLRARASHINNALGGRAEAIATLQAAAAIRPTQELRDEAVSALALDDFQESGDFRPLPNAPHADFNHDFTLLAYETADHHVVLTNLVTREELIRQHVPDWHVTHLLFSPDERYFGVRSAELIKVWSVSNRTVVLEIPHRVPGHRVNDMSLAFAPDSKSIAYGTRSGLVRIYDIASGAEQPTVQSDSRVGALAWSPDGKRLAVGAQSVVKLWNFEAEAWEFLVDDPAAQLVRCVAWSPDGRFVAAGTDGAIVYVCDTRTGGFRKFQNHDTAVEKIDFHPSGDLIASGDSGGVTRVWGFWTGNAHLVTDRGMALRFSERGDRLAYLRRTDGVGTWALQRSSVFRNLPIVRENGQGFPLIEISQTGDHLVVAQQNGLHIVRLAEDLRDCRRLGFKAFPVADAPRRSGIYAAIQHPQTSAWITMSKQGPSLLHFNFSDTATAADLAAANWSFPHWPRRFFLNGANASVDRTKIVGRTITPNIGIVYDPLQSGLPQTNKSTFGLSDVALSANDRWLAQGVGTWLRGAHVREFATGNLVADVGESGMRLAFSPDSQYFITGGLAHFDVWNTSTWQRQHRITKGSTGFDRADAVFSPDSQRLALVYSADLIQIRSAATGQLRTTLHSPDRAGLNAIRYSPDGKLLTAATKDAGIHLWQLDRLEAELSRLGLAADSVLRNQEQYHQAHIPSVLGTLNLQQTMAVIALGVVITVALALFTLRRHRRLLGTYLELEELASKRNEELATAQAESLQNQKMKALGTLAAGMAHDFNNLLSVIRMSNQLTLERIPDDDDVSRTNLGLIEKSVAQGKGVVRSILGYSREPEDGEGMPIDDLVEGTVAMLGPQFLSGIQLKLRLEPGLPASRASRSGLQQILLNLIVNAADAMDGKGRLDIDVNTVNQIAGDCVLRPADAQRWIQLRVSDSGHGIPDDMRERVFEPFYTTKAQSTTPGAGLGLSTIYTIAERDGLGIQLTSSPDAGTVFRILIPAEEQTERSP